MAREEAGAIIVHGGAWAIPDALRDGTLRAVQEAARVGYEVLCDPARTALDAVEAACRVMEDAPEIDSGFGSVLNEDGGVEMDALLIDGASLNFGAIAGVNCVRHPITLARAVMERTPHVMLAGAGANRFARECGVELVDERDMVTPGARAEWEAMRSYQHSVTSSFSPKTVLDAAAEGGSAAGAPTRGHDTCGAVAVDRHGNVAAGTTTGGITMKRVGRVGDSPLIGCGGAADNAVGAASTTGHGESIARVQLAARVLRNAEGEDAADRSDEGSSGVVSPSASALCRRAIEHMQRRTGGAGGVILVLRDGRVGFSFNTERMAWAARSGAGADSGIDA